MTTDITCGSCDYSTAELKEGMHHAGTTGHELTKIVDDEGTTLTISLSFDDEVEDDDFYYEDDEW